MARDRDNKPTVDATTDKPAKEKEASILAIDNGATEKGTIQVTNNVIAAIIKKYALSVDGVLRTAPQSLRDGFSSMLNRRNYESSINIELADEGAIITMALIFRFGVSIPEVTKNIQNVLFDKIPALSGYAVSKVNINVIDLEEEEPEEAEAEEEASENK